LYSITVDPQKPLVWEFCKTAGPDSPAQSPRPEKQSEASGYAGNQSSDRHPTQNPAISHPESFWILFLLLVPESSMQVLAMALGAEIQN
jgi:hypothetical protein